MKALFLCLGTYKVKDTTGADPDNFDRQLLYAIALNRLARLVEKDMGILVVENSAASVGELHPPLQQALKLPQITDVLFSQDNSVGKKNKGAGEYGLCKFAFAQRRDLFEQNEWIIYYTHRHTMPFPLVFEYLKTYSGYDALVSDASYLFPDGSASVTGEGGTFDDLIFAMKTPLFLRYLETMEPELMVKKRLGSEQNLYNFLTGQKINYKKVERFGLLRYNYFTSQMEVV